MKLLQQPEDGITALLHGINHAKNSIDIVIFRFDQPEIEKALSAAVSRGVAVQALIAHVNGSGEESLRKLEMRLLAAGVTVSRTAGDFVRYHAKLMVVDHAELYLLAFNFTKLDINRSRSFGIIVKDGKLVREALKLVEADTKRQPYEAGLPNFVVSPANARQELAAFIEGAKQQLLIYDPKVSDRSMLRVLESRAKAGVEIRIIGQVSSDSNSLGVRRLVSPRLHTRAIVRDGQSAFLGSQSLREMELDRRREAGIIFDDPAIAARLGKTFEEDWELSKPSAKTEAAREEGPPVAKMAKRVAKAVIKELPPVAPVLEVTIKELAPNEITLDPQVVEEAVEEAVKDAVKDAIKEVLEDVVEKPRENQKPAA